MAFDRQPQARHFRQHAGVARDDDTDAVRGDRAARGLHANGLAALDVDAGDRALLDDIDAERVRCPREAPGDGVVARHAPAALQRCAKHGIARVGRYVEAGNRLGEFGRTDDLGVDAVEPVGVDAPLDVAHVLQRMAEVVDAALAEHDVVVQIPAQPLPESHRLLVQQRRFGPEIIGADDGGVATGVAPADPAFFEHSDIAHAMVFRQIIRRREAVAAATDDDRVVALFRFRAAPGRAPVPVMAERVAQQAVCRVLGHGVNPRRFCDSASLRAE